MSRAERVEGRLLQEPPFFCPRQATSQERRLAKSQTASQLIVVVAKFVVVVALLPRMWAVR